MSSETGTGLEFVRPGGFADYLREYQILINGEPKGWIARNDVLRIDVPPGPVTVQARIDWTRSLPISVQVKPQTRTRLEVVNTWGVLLALYGATLGYKSYLTVRDLTA